jgi:hypothetical protein
MGRPRIESISTEELLQLYRECGNLSCITAEALKQRGISMSARTVRRRLAEEYPGYNKPTDSDARPVAGGYIKSPDKNRAVLSGKRYVFTCAQNNTYVHKDFLRSLHTFCKANSAELIVSTVSYNKSGFQNSTKDNDSLWYDPEIVPFIRNESLQVAQGLIFCGELDILPTAVDPLSGFGSYVQNCSGIVPHTKVRMESLPRMKGEHARFLYTTGSVTQRNYIQRTAGQKAEFHHVFGALYVEIDDDGDWFARQLIASEDGSFYDLSERYTPSGVSTDNVASIVWGDIHIEKMDNDVAYTSWFSENCILDVLQPDTQFIHDLTDFSRRNHHNINDPHFLVKEYVNRPFSAVEHDMTMCGIFLSTIGRLWCQTVIVESNHDQALLRWLKTGDVRQDPENAYFWHLANAEVLKNIHARNDEFNVFEWAATRNCPDLQDAIFLQEDDSYTVCGIEHSMHGHRGPNGARGNPRGFKAIGKKVNIGHMHSAGIHDGVYVAGVSANLDMGYNKGPSSWSHSHIVTYKNGKRAIITLRGKKWKA